MVDSAQAISVETVRKEMRLIWILDSQLGHYSCRYEVLTMYSVVSVFDWRELLIGVKKTNAVSDNEQTRCILRREVGKPIVSVQVRHIVQCATIRR